MAPHSDHELDSNAASDVRGIEIPVLIVGGGPAGMVLAHMLSELGGR
jgi:NADPH-dependent 2,4-dienoyl-CoA reductase/sulfur reductase-like enzyme